MRFWVGIIFSFIFFQGVLAQPAKKTLKSADELISLGEFSDALRMLDSLATEAPENPDIYITRSKVWQSLSVHDSAAMDLEKAAGLVKRGSFSLLIQAGQLFYDASQFKDALRCFDNARLADPGNVDALRGSIKSLVKLGYFDSAEQLSSDLVKKTGEPVDYMLYARILEVENKITQASGIYQRMTSQAIKMAEPYLEYSRILFDSDSLDKALKMANKAIELDSVGYEAKGIKGKIYYKKGMYKDALPLLSVPLDHGISDSSLYYYRGLNNISLQRNLDAIHDFTKALELSSKFPEALLGRAAAYTKVNRKEEALSDLTTIKQQLGKPENAEETKMLGDVERRIFELSRESKEPEIHISFPVLTDDLYARVPGDSSTMEIRGTITDQSSITSVRINDQEINFETNDSLVKFDTIIEIGAGKIVSVSATDVYENTGLKTFSIVQNETTPPRISILAPFVTDSNEISIAPGQTSLYIEGKTEDESSIKSILLDTVEASFRKEILNPTFMGVIKTTNRDRFSIRAIDKYGNEQVSEYKLVRKVAENQAANPFGVTWVVLIENSNYREYISPESVSADIQMVKTVFSDYQISNVIHKKNVTKNDLEKFFSIELRDLMRVYKVSSLIIWYGGLGTKSKGLCYWMPVDAVPNDEFSLFNMNALRASLMSYPPDLKHILIVSDGVSLNPCFSVITEIPEVSGYCSNQDLIQQPCALTLSGNGYNGENAPSAITREFSRILSSSDQSCITLSEILSKMTVNEENSDKDLPVEIGRIQGLKQDKGDFVFFKRNSYNP